MGLLVRIRHAAAVLVALAVVPAAAAPQRLDKFVVALRPDKNPDQMLEERRALGQYLSSRMGRPVEVIVPLSAAVIIEGLAGGSIDLAYLSATDMLAARRAGAAQALRVGEIGGRTDYRSYWVTLKEKPYSKVEDLRGRRVAFASRTSTSGYLVPHADLVRKGLLPAGRDPEEFFGKGNVFYGTGYVSAVERVFAGEAEAAAVSDYVLDQDRHLTAEQRGRLRKLAEQGPVPTHVVAVRASIDPEDRARLAQALDAMDEAPFRTLRDKVFTSKLVAVDEARHLAPLEEAMRLSGKQP